MLTQGPLLAVIMSSENVGSSSASSDSGALPTRPSRSTLLRNWQDREHRGGVANWDEYVAESWWHETPSLHEAQEDASALLESYLRVARLPRLTLAYDLL